jgi:hypothetical protein
MAHPRRRSCDRCYFGRNSRVQITRTSLTCRITSRCTWHASCGTLITTWASCLQVILSVSRIPFHRN